MEVLLLMVLLAPLVLGSNGLQTRLVQTRRVQTRLLHPGDDVALTGPDCSGNASVTVKRPADDRYIYYYVDGNVMRPHHQDPSFVDRVKRKEGDTVGVILMKLTPEDDGQITLSCTEINGTTKFEYIYVLEVSDGGAADGNNTSGNNTSGNATSGNATSGNATSGNATSGNPPDVRAIIGGTVGIVAVLGIVMIVILYFCSSRFRRKLRDVCICQQVFDSRSDRPVSYGEVNQQQI